MKQTTFQHPELRDANDNIIQQGAFGKNTALANSTNDGWIDYVANDLEALYDAQMAAGNAITTGTLTVSGKTTTGTLEASSATVSGQTTTGTLAAGDTTVTGTIATSGLTVTGETSVPTANEGNSSKAIANTEFVAKSLASLVNGAPEQLNTLNELAKALGNNANFSATITAELAKKLNSAEAESTYATKTEAGVPYQIKRNTAYKVGDVLTSPSLPYYVLRCTVAGTSGAAEPDYTDVALGDEITDGTVTWVVDGYLPLTGGTMTGSIQYVENGKVFAIGNTDPGNVDLGWNWVNSEGAGIGLRSADHLKNPGEFNLYARDSANSCSLEGKPDGSLTWNSQPLLPVGIVQAFAGTTIPRGWLLCDGSAVSRTDYAALFAVIGTTYGTGNGSTTFNLPNLVDKFVEGSATAGTVKSAGLPNITGYFDSDGICATAGGAFGFSDSGKKGAASNDSGFWREGSITFYASRSSSVYGNSSTVQPPALTMRYIIKY